MFELPDSKRVWRSDLFAGDDDSDSSRRSSLDLEAEAQLKARLEALYGGGNEHAETSTSRRKEGLHGNAVERVGDEAGEAELRDNDSDDGHGGEHEFEFRLFAAPTGKPDLASKDTKMQDTTVQKIILDDEEEDLGTESGRFLNIRDPRVWVVRHATGERKLGFESMAVSGADILEGREKRYWGLEVPWRVKVLRVIDAKKQKKSKSSKEGKIIAVGEEDAEDAKRKRPGKKRRLILRERSRKAEVLKEAKKKASEDKEAAEKEKRTRRNREKKVKRKMKEKAMKAAAPPKGVEQSVETAQGND